MLKELQSNKNVSKRRPRNLYCRDNIDPVATFEVVILQVYFHGNIVGRLWMQNGIQQCGNQHLKYAILQGHPKKDAKFRKSTFIKPNIH